MNAYTQRIGFDVLTAPLAEVDRRGLSQAWYSALHLAREPDATKEQLPQRRSERDAPRSERRPEAAPSAALRGFRGAAARAFSNGAARATVESERRALAPPLARKIERALLRRRDPARLTAFVLDGKHRVHVAVRSCGSQVRVVAVCSPSSTERVRQALEAARYALAGRGVTLAARLRERAR